MKKVRVKTRHEIVGPRKTSFYPVVFADKEHTIMTEEEVMRAVPYMSVLHIPATNPHDERIDNLHRV